MKKVLAFTLLAVSLIGCRKSDEIKVLNNFVMQLLEVTNVSGPYAEYTFSNPRDGWIFIYLTVNAADSGRVRLALDSESTEDVVLVHEAGEERTLEAMRFLSAGEHSVNVWCEGGLLTEKLIIRTMPELIYSRFGYNPHVIEYGPYDWKFLEKKDILKNVNTMGVGASAQLPTSLVKLWKRQGKRFIGYCSAPGLKEPSQAPEAYGYWSGLLNKNPDLDALISDEFYPSSKVQEQWLHWTEAVEKIYAQEQFRDKVFCAYVAGDMWESQLSRSFIQTLMDCSYKFAWERYLVEESTETAARNSLESQLKQPMLAWRKAQPDVGRYMIICLSILSTPPASFTNNNPSVDYKVWMDMQVNVIANDPAFSDLKGLMWWTSGYADEETIRWEARLFRHYCIEGRTEMLSGDPYKLTHIQNPDFNEGTNGWTTTAAEQGSIEVKSYEDYGKLQGRSWRAREGNNFLWMRRSSEGPNVFSQEVRNLRPGRVYSLKMITADYRDLIEGKSNKQTHAVNIEIQDAEIDADKYFQHSFVSRRPRRGFWANYHWLIFRAKGSTAELVISDWASDKEPGGPIGQELIYNFIEIQPYLED